MTKKIKPVHPGEILREEFMAPLGLSMNRVAKDLRVSVTRIADIVNEKRAITADTALRFARYFNNSSTFWMNLQTWFDLEVAASYSSTTSVFAVSFDWRHLRTNLHLRTMTPAGIRLSHLTGLLVGRFE